MPDDIKTSLIEPILSAPSEVKNIIMKVLTLEKERLHEKKPHINADILNIIKEEIQ